MELEEELNETQWKLGGKQITLPSTLTAANTSSFRRTFSMSWASGWVRRKSLWARTRCGCWVPSWLSMAATQFTLTESVIRVGFLGLCLRKEELSCFPETVPLEIYCSLCAYIRARGWATWDGLGMDGPEPNSVLWWKLGFGMLSAYASLFIVF